MRGGRDGKETLEARRGRCCPPGKQVDGLQVGRGGKAKGNKGGAWFPADLFGFGQGTDLREYRRGIESVTSVSNCCIIDLTKD